MGARAFVEELLLAMDVRLDGRRPHDLNVHDERFFARVLADGTLGLGESYVDGWWDCGDVPELFFRLTRNAADARLPRTARAAWESLKARLLNLQSRRRAAIPARDHYDQTVAAYRSMTDRWHTLSCAYWVDAEGLDQAQERKLELICRKLGLEARHRVLDVGCGLGSFARYATTTRGCRVVGINVSGEQLRAARELAAGLPVEFVQCDYRDVAAYTGGGPFDRVVSCGMFEHVGRKNHRAYFEAAHAALADGGLFLLHTVGSNVSQHRNDPWFDKYIFPNGLLPSIRQVGRAIEGLFVMEDWHNFGPHYERTLRAWHERFDARWTKPRGDRFYRMWTYYLLSLAGTFRSRYNQLWHVVLSKGGVPGGYASVR